MCEFRHLPETAPFRLALSPDQIVATKPHLESISPTQQSQQGRGIGRFLNSASLSRGRAKASGVSNSGDRIRFRIPQLGQSACRRPLLHSVKARSSSSNTVNVRLGGTVAALTARTGCATTKAALSWLKHDVSFGGTVAALTARTRRAAAVTATSNLR